MTIDNKSTGNIISGTIKYLGRKPTIEYSSQANLGILTINSQDQEGEDRTFHLSPSLPTTLDAGIGAGIVNVDLTNLNVPEVNIGAGAGEVNVTFSNKYSTVASLAAGAGSLKILIPKNVGHKIVLGQGASYVDLQFGPEYVKTTDGFESTNYNSSAVKADITVGQALGGFNLKTFAE